MGSRINAGINWSLNELKELVDDENSCVHFERARRHIALHPYHLTDLNKALHEILSSSINFYDQELKGLLLAYKNPKLLSSLGSILYDSYFIHIDIEADFYVFRPNIGSILNGIVNKQAINHVGVLVHKAFNVSIPLNGDDDEWQYPDVGKDVKFTVTHVDFKGKLPYIRGELFSSSKETLVESSELESSPLKNNNETVNDENPELSDNTINSKHSPSKRKVNFLTSILNQSSDSSSEEETENIKKSVVQKQDNIANSEHKKRADIVNQSKNDIAFRVNGKYSSDKDSSDEVDYKYHEKNKLKNPKVEECSDSEDEDRKIIVKKKDKSSIDKTSIQAISTPITNSDKKPRIIHDRMLNYEERTIKIDRESLKTPKKSGIFAHDISDSEDESDDQWKPLTQTVSLSRKKKEIIDNNIKNTESIDMNDESIEEHNISIKKESESSKKIKHKKISLEDETDIKTDIKNKTLSSPRKKIDKVEKDSRTSIDKECNVKTDKNDNSLNSSESNTDTKVEKKIKKKSKSLTPDKTQNTATDNLIPPRPTKIEKDTPSPLKNSHKSDENNSAHSDVSTPSPKKTKVKHESIFVNNVRIKREPDASDCENSSSTKSKHRHSNSFEEVTVKHESNIVKKEIKKESSKSKRKHKDSNKNDSIVKREIDSSDSETSFLPRKKMKTIFSE